MFWGAIDLFRGRLGATGMTWQNVSSRKTGDSIHPDQHLWPSTNTPGVVYSCNDGGVYRSADRGEHWASLNPGVGITEFEFLAQLEGSRSWLMGGTQDNGSLALAGPRHWDQIALGDGGDCAAVDRGNSSICYHSYYDMPIERAAALGTQAFDWTEVTPPIPKGYAALFYPPLEASGSMLVKAGSTVWVSADNGDNWDEIALPTSTDADPDLATALAIVGDHTVIVGMGSGQLWRVARGSGSWSAASVTALAKLPTQYVSDLAVIGSTAKTIWATCSRMGGPHVFRSQDSGKTFKNCNCQPARCARQRAGSGPEEHQQGLRRYRPWCLPQHQFRPQLERLQQWLAARDRRRTDSSCRDRVCCAPGRAAGALGN